MDRLEPTAFITFDYGDVLPSEDRISSWASVIALICNDSILDAHNMLRSSERPHELSYFMRIAAGHVYEAAKFMASTAEWPEVEELVGLLDDARHGDWDRVVALWQKTHPMRPQLDNARHQVFHYPRVYEAKGRKEVSAALDRLKDAEGEIALGESLGRYRFRFADEVALNMITEVPRSEEADAFASFAEGLRDLVLPLQRCTEAVLGLFFASRGSFTEIEGPAEAS